MSTGWQPPSTFEERIKDLLVPPGLYMKYRVAKELRRGEAETRLLPFLVDHGRAALDIGANKGVYTHLLGPLATQVYAFEPNPKLFKSLIRSLPRNATAQQLAISNAKGTAELRIPRGSKKGFSNQGGSLSAKKVQGEYGAVTVETVRIDDLDLPPVGFIKVDVEGFELQTLEGAPETLARDRPVLLIEMEERHTGIPIEDMIRTVEAYGYTGFALHNGRLTKALSLDFDVCHRPMVGKRGYVFNFIFFPGGAG